jgi:hypothetical protein
MARATTTPRATSAPFDFSKVHFCRIHPGIGIARVGNSREGYFIGPEVPYDPRDVTAPPGGYKDAEGRVKRQAARFRIYAYDKNGKNLGELPLGGRKGAEEGRCAYVKWTVHLKNKKGAWYKFFGRYDEATGVRNWDIPVGDGKPDDRASLVIDPGPRCIDSSGEVCSREDGSESLQFDTGTFRGTQVPLGELRTDEHGRLLVFGGYGRSDSTKPDNPIGADPNDEGYWADNDCWYDDMSDGCITALVTLPHGPKNRTRDIPVKDAKDAAWVVVAPPNFAPGVNSIVTLYDAIREVVREHNDGAEPTDKAWSWPKDNKVFYYRDIRPMLMRAADTAWVNRAAQRGHGFDKRGDFRKEKIGEKLKIGDKLLALPELASPRTSNEQRVRIFRRLRDPNIDPDADPPKAARQARSGFMPALSGDGGDAEQGKFRTWSAILRSQYRKFELWSTDKFEPGEPEKFPSLEQMNFDAQVVALQRAALEPCVGGPLYPGIEMPWIVNDPRYADLYAGAFRINSNVYKPGDITKYMCVPWQADFYDCKDNWWPSARPDDVVPETAFNEANKAWRPGQPPLSEALEGREKWDRGLGVTTLFRRPWQNPAEATDDPRDSERRGCDDMVRYWSELGFVLPRKTAWWEAASNDSEMVLVETERRPYAGMDVRELFHCLLNLDQHRDCLPKVQEFVENVLEASRRVQATAGAFAWMDNIRPFEYDEHVFDQRMKDIYDDCADFAFTYQADDGTREEYDPGNVNHNPYFRTRENVIERIRQLTPFNFLDGAWLRNIHRVGPVDEVNAILFTILKEELGDGVVSQNHANIYRDLCHSFGFYPPAMQSTAFAYDPQFLDAAFDSPAFQLGISEFSNRYYPEIIGMSLWLEWTVLELHRIAAMVELAKLNSHFYRMHIAIDNAASGHGAEIVRAVKLYLRQVRVEGGEAAVRCHWRRIWDGYVAFAQTFVIIIKQVIKTIQDPPPLRERLKWLIRQKQPYGELNHSRQPPLHGTSINAWFSDPEGFLDALVKGGYIIPGKPNRSKFFKLLEFQGGPMYHVFTDEEIKLWRDWTWELGQQEKQLPALLALRERLEVLNPDITRRLSDDDLIRWQVGASDYRIGLWVELAATETRSAAKRARTTKQRASDKRQPADPAKDYIEGRLKDWVGSGMIRAVTYIAAQFPTAFDGYELRVPDPTDGEDLTVDEWFDRIRKAPNSAFPAHEFLTQLGKMLRARAGLLKELFDGDTPLACAFQSGIPGNDGRRARDTMEAWVKTAYWLPKIAEGRVKALRLDASLDEEEHHPTGVMMGFGTTH